ncbi:hypothetical protein COP2_035594 [Malus domestica]
MTLRKTKKKKKQLKKGDSGLLSSLPLSNSVLKFLNNWERLLSRAGDPTDKRRTVCDDKLKELFGVDSFNGFLSLRCSDYSFSSRWDILTPKCKYFEPN